MMDYKQLIIENLEVLRKNEQAKKEVWKARAYAKVIKTLKDRTEPIHSIDDAKDIPGVGDKIREKIAEIIKTGELHQIKEIKNNPNISLIDEFMKIHAIGPAKARELVIEKGIKSIEELIKRQDELLNDKQKIGLKYHNDIQLRIPRSEMDKHNEYLQTIVKKIDPMLKVQLTGSYRRGEKDSGDIDALITYPYNYTPAPDVIKDIGKELQQSNYITEILAIGDKKCLSICRLKYHKRYRRLDLMLTSPDQFPFALLYFTGSQVFNVAMRSHALSKGYSLNEYGLTDTTTKKVIQCNIHTEDDIFRFLDMKYIEPQKRTPGIIIETL